MQELEKIIEKMKEIKDGNRKEKLYAKYPPNSKDQEVLNAYSQGYEDGTDNFYNAIVDDVRNHINDGWIPVEERLPKAPEMEDEYPEFNVMIEGAKTPTTLQYTYEGIWVDDYGNAYDVIAWQPLPEPYIPRNQNKPEEHYPEWRAKFLNKFDRRL